MAVVKHDSGTLTPSVIGTAEEFWTAITTDGTYQLVIQVDNLADGDEVEFYYEVQVIPAAGYSQAFPKAYYSNDQGARAIVLPEIKNIDGLKGWINQTVGTARAFKWVLYRYD